MNNCQNLQLLLSDEDKHDVDVVGLNVWGI